MVGVPPPFCNASLARRSAENGPGRGRQTPAGRPSPDPAVGTWSPCGAARPAYGRSGSACRASRVAPAPNRHGNAPCRGSPIAGVSAPRSRSRAGRTVAPPSITSRPLFIMVAESMLILAPIDHTGWRKAASGEATSISSSVAVRNGPPEAVRMIFSTAARFAVGQRLENRVVLRIDRQQRRPGLPDRIQHHVAGTDQGFLVGQPNVGAAANRGPASVRGRPHR